MEETKEPIPEPPKLERQTAQTFPSPTEDASKWFTENDYLNMFHSLLFQLKVKLAKLGEDKKEKPNEVLFLELPIPPKNPEYLDLGNEYLKSYVFEPFVDPEGHGYVTVVKCEVPKNVLKDVIHRSFEEFVEFLHVDTEVHSIKEVQKMILDKAKDEHFSQITYIGMREEKYNGELHRIYYHPTGVYVWSFPILAEHPELYATEINSKTIFLQHFEVPMMIVPDEAVKFTAYRYLDE